MSMSRKLKKKLMAAAFAFAVASASAANVNAAVLMPTNGKIVFGGYAIAGSGTPPSDYVLGEGFDGMKLIANQNTLINWDTFNLGAGGTITLDANGNVFVHQVTGGVTSVIEGTLLSGSSGNVYLINPSGVYTSGGVISGVNTTINALITG